MNENRDGFDCLMLEIGREPRVSEFKRGLITDLVDVGERTLALDTIVDMCLERGYVDIEIAKELAYVSRDTEFHKLTQELLEAFRS